MILIFHLSPITKVVSGFLSLSVKNHSDSLPSFLLRKTQVPLVYPDKRAEI